MAKINLDTQIKGSSWPSYTATDSGSVNAYAVSGIPLAPSLRGGSIIIFKAANTNTGASTLAVNGGSAIAIKKLGGSALVAGDIVANEMVTVVYDTVSSTFLYLTPSTINAASQITGILPVANGGTGTSTPSLVAGTNVTITGTWPNQTIASSGGGGGGGTGVYPALTPPALTSFSWVNQLDRTASTQSNRLLFTIPPHADPNLSLLTWNTALSTPHTIDAAFEHGGVQSSGSIQDFQGIGIRDSASGKFITFYIRVNGTSSNIFVVKWNSVTSVSSVLTSPAWGVQTTINFFRITDNGATRKYQFSMNGWDYVDVTSEASATFITPNQALIGGLNSVSVTLVGACWNWSVT